MGQLQNERREKTNLSNAQGSRRKFRAHKAVSNRRDTRRSKPNASGSSEGHQGTPSRNSANRAKVRAERGQSRQENRPRNPKGRRAKISAGRHRKASRRPRSLNSAARDEVAGNRGHVQRRSSGNPHQTNRSRRKAHSRPKDERA